MSGMIITKRRSGKIGIGSSGWLLWKLYIGITYLEGIGCVNYDEACTT